MYTLILFDTRLGWMGVIGSIKGLKRVIFPQKSRKSVVDIAEGELVFTSEKFSKILKDLPERLSLYIEGKKMDFLDKLDLTGSTVFQKKVWEAARKIPYGETISYGSLASSIGCNRGARAVGQALSRNPVPIVVPCHRIVGKNGVLTGFRGGLTLKQLLLDIEKSKIEFGPVI